MKKMEICISKNHDKGFTLVEVIVALAIITVGILAVNAMQTVSVRGNYTASDLTSASTWASDRVEQIINLPYNDPLLQDDGVNSGGPDVNANGIDDDDEGLGGDGVLNFGLDETAAPDFTDTSNDVDQRYTIDWNVVANYPMPNVKTIHIMVTRNDRGVSKTVTLKTRKALFF